MDSRVIFLVENMSFPQDRRVRQEAEALATRGWKVSVICPRGGTDGSSSFEVIDNIKVYRYRQPFQGGGMLGYVLEYGWAMLASFILILSIWAKDGFDVLHAANPPDLFFLVAAPFLLCGKKFVYDQHDLCPELLAFKFQRATALRSILFFLERCSYRLADLVIVTNQSAYETARKRGGVQPEKLCIVRNGPDLRYFNSIAPCPYLKDPARYLVVYVGSIAKQDGVDTLVKAANHIIHTRGRTDVKFALLGDGDSLQELRDLVGVLGIERYVSFAGWVGDSKLLEYLSTADVCAAPDAPVPINQLSTFIKIMEYMSCGKVTVSFDLLESRRTAGPAAMFVCTHNPESFGNAILEILDDPLRRERLGQLALERVRTTLHWGLSSEVLVTTYEQVIQRGVLRVHHPEYERLVDLEPAYRNEGQID
ncbi:MAG: glycosyltransferase family 4 protein [Acidobacteriia bacterium]|nr:glycosyltransferase family 4 protein [Terriglobia bacterium]